LDYGLAKKSHPPAFSGLVGVDPPDPWRIGSDLPDFSPSPIVPLSLLLCLSLSLSLSPSPISSLTLDLSVSHLPRYHSLRVSGKKMNRKEEEMKNKKEERKKGKKKEE
jgi:hypothetical protein